MNLFVSEVSFEDVARVMDFTYVFENGEKCNCLLMSMFFGVFCVFGRVSSQNDCFAHKIGFQICVKVIGFSFVFENGYFFCVSSVLFKKLSGKNYAAFCFN